jgi:hypothetical protein
MTYLCETLQLRGLNAAAKYTTALEKRFSTLLTIGNVCRLSEFIDSQQL